jgi:GMP synthase-like glutamine amidotransferase
MVEISTLKENPLFQGDFKAYVLTNFSVKQSQTFEALAESTKCIQAIKHKQKNIYGVLFHPEVRNQEILKNFIQFVI